MTQRQPKYGEVWIYDLAYPLEMEIGHMGTLDGLAKAVGATELNADDVQIVQLKTVEELGLPAFLEMAYGVAQTDMAGMEDTFAKLSGSIAVLRSGAFPSDGITQPPNDQATLVTVLSEELATPTSLTPLTSEASSGTVTPEPAPARKPKSDARIGGMVAMAALVLMFVLVGLMVWIGG
ncbi:hypothetical protein [Yoonia sp. 208BN28-4]|uniref:hypothetical protein n=1 Tax=Yoonia sp. 208BN28-4 TaxID=3126505 RepID=UPI00309C77CB